MTDIKHNPETFEVDGKTFSSEGEAKQYAAAVAEVDAWIATLPEPAPKMGADGPLRTRDNRKSARRYALAYLHWSIARGSESTLKAVSA